MGTITSPLICLEAVTVVTHDGVTSRATTGCGADELLYATALAGATVLSVGPVGTNPASGNAGSTADSTRCTTAIGHAASLRPAVIGVGNTHRSGIHYIAVLILNVLFSIKIRFCHMLFLKRVRNSYTRLCEAFYCKLVSSTLPTAK